MPMSYDYRITLYSKHIHFTHSIKSQMKEKKVSGILGDVHRVMMINSKGL